MPPMPSTRSTQNLRDREHGVPPRPGRANNSPLVAESAPRQQRGLTRQYPPVVSLTSRVSAFLRSRQPRPTVRVRPDLRQAEAVFRVGQLHGDQQVAIGGGG